MAYGNWAVLKKKPPELSVAGVHTVQEQALIINDIIKMYLSVYGCKCGDVF